MFLHWETWMLSTMSTMVTNTLLSLQPFIHRPVLNTSSPVLASLLKESQEEPHTPPWYPLTKNTTKRQKHWTTQHKCKNIMLQLRNICHLGRSIWCLIRHHQESICHQNTIPPLPLHTCPPTILHQRITFLQVPQVQ